MKALTKLFVVLFSVSLFSSSILADQWPDIPDAYKAKYEQIEANLLVGLKSDNIGLRLSCAYYLGEIKSQKSLIPLLALLRDNNTDEERIMAALALAKIDSKKGLYAVRRVGELDNNPRLRKLCCRFYNAAINQEKFEESMEQLLSRVINSGTNAYGYALSDFETDK